MLRLALVLVVLAAPLALADAERQSAIGTHAGNGGVGFGGTEVSFGDGLVGQWQGFDWNATAGTRTLGLSWAASTPPIPWADYDLRLYRPGTFADGIVDDTELLAQASTHPGGPHTESLTYTVATGVYAVVVVPYQAQDEEFTLTSSAGDLTYVGFIPSFRTPPATVRLG